MKTAMTTNTISNQIIRRIIQLVKVNVVNIKSFDGIPTFLACKTISFPNLISKGDRKGRFVMGKNVTLSTLPGWVKRANSLLAQFLSGLFAQFPTSRGMNASTKPRTVFTPTLVNTRLSSQEWFSTVKAFYFNSFSSNRTLNRGTNTQNRTVFTTALSNFGWPSLKGLMALLTNTSNHIRTDYTKQLTLRSRGGQ